MSREIKFRAWCNDQKRMFTKVLVGNIANPDSHDYTAHCIFNDGGWYNSDEYDDVVFMQHTGLKDKNGDDIYIDNLADAFVEMYEMLDSKLDLIRCGIGANYSGNPKENPKYLEVTELLERAKGGCKWDEVHDGGQHESMDKC